MRERAREPGDRAPEAADPARRRPRRCGRDPVARDDPVQREGDRLGAEDRLDPAHVEHRERGRTDRDAQHRAGQHGAQHAGVGTTAPCPQPKQVHRDQDRQHHRRGDRRRQRERHQRHRQHAQSVAARLRHAREQHRGHRDRPERGLGDHPAVRASADGRRARRPAVPAAQRRGITAPGRPRRTRSAAAAASPWPGRRGRGCTGSWTGTVPRERTRRRRARCRSRTSVRRRARPRARRA